MHSWSATQQLRSAWQVLDSLCHTPSYPQAAAAGRRGLGLAMDGIQRLLGILLQVVVEHGLRRRGTSTFAQP